MVPPEVKLSSKNSSSSEEIPDYVKRKKVATEKIEIEEESTHTEIHVPVQKTHTSESSKIKTKLKLKLFWYLKQSKLNTRNLLELTHCFKNQNNLQFKIQWPHKTFLEHTSIDKSAII